MTKIATDLEQSKKLAEILPLESADMYWEYNHNIHTYDDIPRVLVVNNWDDDYNKDIPCWSLTALLNVLPYTIKDNIGREFKFKLESVENDAGYRGYRIQYYQDIECYLMTMYDYNSPIDACYEMIIKLHEKGLL